MYRRLLASYLLVFCFFSSKSQFRFKFSAIAGSGVSWFGGKGATSTTARYIITSPPGWGGDSLSNPYGSKPLVIIVAGFRANCYLKNNWLISLNTQFETAGGINRITETVTDGVTQITNDKHSFRHLVVGLNPTIGKSFGKKNLLIMPHTGFEYDFELETDETIETQTPDGKEISGSGGFSSVFDHTRLTAGVTATINKWGFDICYKHGLENYTGNKTAKANLNIIELKLLYKIISFRR